MAYFHINFISFAKEKGMKKYSDLLHKIDVFEKLAVYGDRKTYLKSLASSTIPVASLPGTLVNNLNSLFTLINNPNLELKYLDTMEGGNVNVDQLTSLVQSAPTTDPNATNLVNQIVSQLKQIKGPEVDSGHYAPIPKETQDQLNKLLVPSGDIFPLKTDGLLGQKTKDAIDIFKRKYNAPGTVESIKEVYLRENNPDIVTKTPF